MAATYSLDTIVVNFHTPSDLEGFIASYAAFPPSCWNTLFVVNVDSSEAEDRQAMEALLSANFNYRTSWNYVPTEKNVGYSGAVNWAASSGNNEFIAAFNADTRITPGVLDKCLDHMEAQPGIGVLGPRQVDDQNRLTHAGIVGTESEPRFRCWLDDDRGQFDDIIDAITVSGSAYFVRRETWQELTDCPIYQGLHPDAIGAFLPTPHYYEETWASYHARAHGWSVVYYGAAKMIHRWHKASPVGGWAEQQVTTSQKMFRAACDAHGIAHD